MRRAERPYTHQLAPVRQLAGNTVDFGDLQSLLVIHFRQYGGKPAHQHGFACARRPDKQEIMLAGGRNDQRPFGLVLAANIRVVLSWMAPIAAISRIARC
ncbi:hypothetical protein D3C87_1810800 [compost metagenome]